MESMASNRGRFGAAAQQQALGATQHAPSAPSQQSWLSQQHSSPGQQQSPSEQHDVVSQPVLHEPITARGALVAVASAVAAPPSASRPIIENRKERLFMGNLTEVECVVGLCARHAAAQRWIRPIGNAIG